MGTGEKGYVTTAKGVRIAAKDKACAAGVEGVYKSMSRKEVALKEKVCALQDECGKDVLDAPILWNMGTVDMNFTLLCNAAKLGFIEAAKILLENGANPNVLCSSGGYTYPPFAVAASAHNVEVMRILLCYNADASAVVQSPNGKEGPIKYTLGYQETLKAIKNEGCEFSNLAQYKCGAQDVMGYNVQVFEQEVLMIIEFSGELGQENVAGA